jgi:glucose uptake protein GlcU
MCINPILFQKILIFLFFIGLLLPESLAFFRNKNNEASEDVHFKTKVLTFFKSLSIAFGTFTVLLSVISLVELFVALPFSFLNQTFIFSGITGWIMLIIGNFDKKERFLFIKGCLLILVTIVCIYILFN